MPRIVWIIRSVTLAILSLWVVVSSANTYVVRPIAIKDCGVLPADLQWDEKPTMCSGKPVEINFLIEGKDLVNIDKDSLKIESMTLNGKDIAKNRLGEPTYQISSFPKVSKSGKYIIFGIELNDAYLGQVGNIELTASIEVSTSSDLKTVVNEVDLSKPFKHTYGLYTVTNHHDKRSNGAVTDAMANAFMEGFTNLFSGNNTEESLSLTVVGNLDNFISLGIEEGNKSIKSGGSSWFNDQKTLSFEKPSQPVVELKLAYWDNLEVRKLNFSL